MVDLSKKDGFAFGTAELRILKGDYNPEDPFAAVIKMLSCHGRIRNINGLISETWNYGDLFT